VRDLVDDDRDRQDESVVVSRRDLDAIHVSEQEPALPDGRDPA
jgi:hypothetical protein